MQRREFLRVLCSAAVAWPTVTRAQQQTLRHIAVLMATKDTDPDGRAQLDAFLQSFRQLGWEDGRNVKVDIRWSGGSFERTRDIAAELVAAKPDVIVANSTTSAHAMKRATSTIPVVFVLVNEPVAQGIIASVARPGGNMTGFTMVDFSLVGKLVEMLKTMAPATSRVGFMFNPDTYPYYDTYLRELQAEARRPVEVTLWRFAQPPTSTEQLLRSRRNPAAASQFRPIRSPSSIAPRSSQLWNAIVCRIFLSSGTSPGKVG